MNIMDKLINKAESECRQAHNERMEPVSGWVLNIIDKEIEHVFKSTGKRPIRIYIKHRVDGNDLRSIFGMNIVVDENMEELIKIK